MITEAQLILIFLGLLDPYEHARLARLAREGSRPSWDRAGSWTCRDTVEVDPIFVRPRTWTFSTGTGL